MIHYIYKQIIFISYWLESFASAEGLLLANGRQLHFYLDWTINYGILKVLLGMEKKGVKGMTVVRVMTFALQLYRIG